MKEMLTHPAFLVTFALIQAVVFLLLIRFLDLYEREPLSVLALMAAWGATGAVALSLAGNAIVLGLLPPALEKTFGSALAGPLVEEVAKGLAVVVAFSLSWWAARRFGLLELEGLTDGMVYGAAVGLGFAFTEDLLYLFNEADEQGLGAGLSEYASRSVRANAGHGRVGEHRFEGRRLRFRGRLRRVGGALAALSAARDPGRAGRRNESRVSSSRGVGADVPLLEPL